MTAPRRFKRTVVRGKRGGLSPYVWIRQRDRAIHRYTYMLSSHFLRSAIVPPMKPGVCRNISRNLSAECSLVHVGVNRLQRLVRAGYQCPWAVALPSSVAP